MNAIKKSLFRGVMAMVVVAFVLAGAAPPPAGAQQPAAGPQITGVTVDEYSN